MSESTNNLKILEFTWKITNYSQQKLKNGPGNGIRSHPFSVGCEEDLKFILKFYPQGYVKSVDTEVSNGEKWASILLVTEESDSSDTSHHVELSVLDANGEKFGIRHCHKKISKNLCYTKFIRLSRLENAANNLLPNDTLTICCRVEETKSKIEEACDCQMEKTETTRTRRKLCEDLASITDKKYADFVFKVKNEKIAAHRVILDARSPVFAAMFQHDMQENQTNETEITDLTPAVFKALLRFIYTGNCEVRKLAEELLVAANKYDIQDLKQLCAKELRQKLTVDNAVRLLILSDLHQSEDLKEGAIRFINKNAPAVMKTPAWTNFSKSHQHLVLELYSKLFE